MKPAFAVATLFALTSASSAQQPTAEERANNPSVYDLVQMARDEGNDRIVIPPPIEDQLVANGLEDLLPRALVVAATVRSSNTVPSGYYDSELTTWYTVQVTRTLAGSRPRFAPERGLVPETVPRPAADELLVAVSGGRLNIDGVQVISDSLMTRHLTVGGTYLLFLQPRGSGLPLTAVEGGPLGAYEIRGDSLVSFNSNTVAADIAARFRGSLQEVSRAIEALQHSPRVNNGGGHASTLWILVCLSSGFDRQRAGAVPLGLLNNETPTAGKSSISISIPRSVATHRTLTDAANAAAANWNGATDGSGNKTAYYFQVTTNASLADITISQGSPSGSECGGMAKSTKPCQALPSSANQLSRFAGPSRVLEFL
jgi:hypothetical protein